MNEVSVTALNGVTMRQPVKIVDQIDDRAVDHIITQAGQAFLPLFLK
jgi:S-adenosylmethionine synthetase